MARATRSASRPQPDEKHPRHVGHDVERLPVGEKGPSPAHVYDPGNSLDPGRDQIRGLDADEGSRPREQLRA
jgi:hypothetical protein